MARSVRSTIRRKLTGLVSDVPYWYTRFASPRINDAGQVMGKLGQRIFQRSRLVDRFSGAIHLLQSVYPNEIPSAAVFISQCRRTNRLAVAVDVGRHGQALRREAGERERDAGDKRGRPAVAQLDHDPAIAVAADDRIVLHDPLKGASEWATIHNDGCRVTAVGLASLEGRPVVVAALVVVAAGSGFTVFMTESWQLVLCWGVLVGLGTGSMALALVVPVVAILGYLVVKAWPALTPAFLLQNPMNRMTAGGIWAPLIGTFFLVLTSLMLSAPIGILAGVYLNEYARDNWMTRIINLAVVNLAGVPSIVHGLFGVAAFVYCAGMGRSLLAAACTVAVMTLPVIIASTKEALASVPMAFREACWNMGATRWQTIRTIVLPNSISGVLTGVILQVARSAGETAPVLFTGAVFFVPIADAGWRSFIPYGPGDRFMALSYHLWTVSTQVQEVPAGIQYGTAVVLIALVLVVNSISIGLRVYFRSRKRW